MPDESVSSWLDRELALNPRVEGPAARHYRTRDGPMVHPDIRPRSLWVDQVAAIFGIEPSDISKATLSSHYSGLQARYISWMNDPYDHPADVSRKSHRTDVSIKWCSRCLSEDMNRGLPGYIRRDWLLSVQTFCPKHAWPLQGRCSKCRRGCYSPEFRRTPWTGPYCGGCGHPLTRAKSNALRAEPSGLASWKAIVAFENSVKDIVVAKPDRAAARGRAARQAFLAVYGDLFEILVGLDYRENRKLRGIDFFETLALPFERVHVSNFATNCHPMMVTAPSLALRLSATIGALLEPADILPQLLFQRSRAELLGHLRWLYDTGPRSRLMMRRNRWPAEFVASLDAATPQKTLDFQLWDAAGMIDALQRYRRTGQIA